jgi:hypothetical protein
MTQEAEGDSSVNKTRFKILSTLEPNVETLSKESRNFALSSRNLFYRDGLSPSFRTGVFADILDWHILTYLLLISTPTKRRLVS